MLRRFRGPLRASAQPDHHHCPLSITTQGEPGNHFYIVEKGNVFVTKSEQPDQEILELGVGAFFGERALLSEKLGEPRAANVWARGAVLCFSVARADFNTHLGSLQVCERECERECMCACTGCDSHNRMCLFSPRASARAPVRAP